MQDDKLSGSLEMLANRLVKNRRRLKSWIKTADTSCYRLYDRDIPELPLTVDWYDGRLYVCSYRKSDRITEEDHLEWVAQMGAAAGRALEVPEARIYTRIRRKDPGGTQYGKMSSQSFPFVVQESGLKFWVNLGANIDTGLFLDHRNTRRLVRAESVGKRVLNLFAYTGSFSVYAASGGARSTVTVDLSSRYLDWARRNMELNGFVGPEHQYVQGDVVTLLEAGFEGGLFDLVVVDPPTISKSKRMDGSFDIQRDHQQLLKEVLSVCKPGGIIYFSTNYRSFTFCGQLPGGSEIHEITEGTLPDEFRDRKVHRCYKIDKS